MTRHEISVVVLAIFVAPLAKMVEFAALRAVGGPDFLAVLAVSVGWSCDLWSAGPAGFILGLIEDLISGRALGTRAVSLALAAFLASGLRRFLNPDSLSSKMIAAFAGTALADLASWAILLSLGIPITYAHFAKSIWIRSALWSAFLIGPVEALMRRAAGSIQSLLPSSGRKGRETAA